MNKCYSPPRSILIRLLVLIAMLPSLGNSAEVQPWEAGFGLGFIDPGSKRNIDTDLAGLLTLGHHFDKTWTGELFGMVGNDINVFGVRGLYDFNRPFHGWSPYVSAGIGLSNPSPGDTDTTILGGGGLKYPLQDNLAFRTELNLHKGVDSGAMDVSVFAGLTWSWGRNAAAPTRSKPLPPRDADQDGVPDANDMCPDTPASVRVDSQGCPLDSDRDGVPDYKDKCPDTRAGESVNAGGCSLDSDGDGVPDSRDNCANTLAGERVSTDGCPTDSDGDGVPDSRDNCPNTRPGENVNADGCPMDSDRDGVPDDKDRCPGTQSGAKVDVEGCPLKLTEKVGITLKLNFDTGKTDIKPGFADEINRVASFMRQYPGTSVVIEGHTDNTGGKEYNQRLSELRAAAVAESLVQDHGITASRVQSIGYGETRPIADNATAAGRAENRRVTAAIEEIVTRSQ